MEFQALSFTSCDFFFLVHINLRERCYFCFWFTLVSMRNAMLFLGLLCSELHEIILLLGCWHGGSCRVQRSSPFEGEKKSIDYSLIFWQPWEDKEWQHNGNKPLHLYQSPQGTLIIFSFWYKLSTGPSLQHLKCSFGLIHWNHMTSIMDLKESQRTMAL